METNLVRFSQKAELSCQRCNAKDVMANLENLTGVYPALRSSAETAARRSSPSPYGTRARPAPLPARPTSRRGPLGRTAFAQWFNGRFRDRFLNIELFTRAPEAQILADHWRWVATHSDGTRPSRVCRSSR